MTAEPTMSQMMEVLLGIIARLDRIEANYATKQDLQEVKAELIEGSNQLYQSLSDQIQEVADGLAAHLRNHW